MRKGLGVVLACVLALPLIPAPAAADHDGSSHEHASYCFGDPPRTSRDPMSPPCIPFWDGDNGGSTAPGVESDAIRVVVYVDEGCTNAECSRDPLRQPIDLDAPPRPPCDGTWPVRSPEDCDSAQLRLARGLIEHLNHYYMLYGRRIHGYLYIAEEGTPAFRQDDAAEILRTVDPFAVIDDAVFYGSNDVFAEAMSARGRLVFSGPHHSDAEGTWAFSPSAEQRAALFGSYVCQALAGREGEFARAPGGVNVYEGRPRTFGIWRAADPAEPVYAELAQLVEAALAGCGIVAVEETYPSSGWTVNPSSTSELPALGAVSRFQAAGVTTVLYIGGPESDFSHTAAALGYFPEIVLAGDGRIDGAAHGRLQNPLVWANAFGVQSVRRVDSLTSGYGWAAYREFEDDTADMARYAERSYPAYLLMGTGLQMAGPHLKNDHVEAALRAIPTNDGKPFAPSCSFPEGDNSCVNDAMEVWWDPSGRIEGAIEPGCMRMVARGRRHAPGDWDAWPNAFASPTDGCNAYMGSALVGVNF